MVCVCAFVCVVCVVCDSACGCPCVRVWSCRCELHDGLIACTSGRVFGWFAVCVWLCACVWVGVCVC